MMHPHWLRDLRLAIRTRGKEGLSRPFQCLQVCPGCGEPLSVTETTTRYLLMNGEPPSPTDTPYREYTLSCPHCLFQHSPLPKILDSFEAPWSHPLDLDGLNRDLLKHYLPHWEPSQHLLTDDFQKCPLASIYMQAYLETART